MKSLRSKLYFLTLLLIHCIINEAVAQDVFLKRCATADIDSIKIFQNPHLREIKDQEEARIQEYLQTTTSRLRSSADIVVTIPVVVHVVHNQADNKIGGVGNANISDEQIQSQIDVLNEDYSNQSGYKGFYTESRGVDTRIRFRLARIVRKYTDIKTFNNIRTVDKEVSAVSPPWATNRYLNIWVCSFTTGYLGVAQSPSIVENNSALPGATIGDANLTDPLTDGVIIDWHFFGRNSPAITSTTYNLGRTATHEVGHWLGLIHIWGDSRCGTDYCEDTPTAEKSNATTDLTCSPVYSYCTGFGVRNMIENYMDYSPDRCMSVFTNDQMNRMHAFLALSPRRALMVAGTQRTEQTVSIEIFPNPVEKSVNAYIFTPDNQGFVVDVVNIYGAVISKGALNQTYFNVESLPSGIYLMRVTSGSKTVTKRFFVL